MESAYLRKLHVAAVWLLVVGMSTHQAFNLSVTRVRSLTVAVDYFALLGVKPKLSSAFNPEASRPGLGILGIERGTQLRPYAQQGKIIPRSHPSGGRPRKCYSASPLTTRD